MDTICAPAYVNMFMAELEENYIYSLVKNIPFDTFMIWKGN